MCSNKMDGHGNQFINSDATMIATQTFYSILNQVQNSNLNYQLQLSPFSAMISLKRSLLKDKSGNPILPGSSNFVSNETKMLLEHKAHLEQELISLQKDYKCVLGAHKNACATIEALEKHIRDGIMCVKTEAEMEVEKKQLVIDELKNKIGKLEEDVKSHDISISSLKNTCEASQAVACKLNKELSSNRSKFKEEKLALQKELKSNMKDLKKELGTAISENINLKKKIESSADAKNNCVKLKKKKKSDKTAASKLVVMSDLPETSILTSSEDQVFCSLCGIHIQDYTPKYFMGEEVNAACVKCEDKDDIYDKEVPTPKKVVKPLSYPDTDPTNYHRNLEKDGT